MMSKRVVIAEGRIFASDCAASKPELPGPPGLMSKTPILLEDSDARARNSARSITFAPFARGLSDARRPTFIEPHSPPEHLRHEIFDALGVEGLGLEGPGLEGLGLEGLEAEPAPLLALHPEATRAKTSSALVQILDRVRLIVSEER